MFHPKRITKLLREAYLQKEQNPPPKYRFRIKEFLALCKKGRKD
jgi:hypothetical protein